MRGRGMRGDVACVMTSHVMTWRVMTWQVNADWIATTKRMNGAGTAFKATHLDGVLELLIHRDDTLVRLQKSLD